jgi:hypothetical protein
MTLYVACTDECCEDASGLCESPELAIDDWMENRLDGWRERICEDCLNADLQDCSTAFGCTRYPDEINVLGVEWKPVKMPLKLAMHVLEDVDEVNQDRPESDDYWPPWNEGKALDDLTATIQKAVLDYLEATTGVRTCSWWQAVESWVYVRGDDGEWRRKEA